MQGLNRTTKMLLTLLALMTATLVYIAGCQPSKPASAPSQEPAPTQEATFVGNAACEPCHADIFKLHHGSNHDRTMRTASVKEMGDQFPKAGAIEGYPFVLSATNGALTLAPKADANAAIPMN